MKCCDTNVRRDRNAGTDQDGDRYICPDCEREWEHVCDEAEGCYWVRATPSIAWSAGR